MRQETINIYQFDELSDAAKERAIEKMREISEYPWFDECLGSLRAFCDEFSVRVTDYTLSDCYRAHISTDATPKHFRGVKLSSFERESMPTCFGFDCDLRYTFYDEFKRTGNAYHAFEMAIEAFLSSVKKDIEWQYSDECIAENIEANGYEFTENGDLA